jgi:hypothetical protein
MRKFFEEENKRFMEIFRGFLEKEIKDLSSLNRRIKKDYRQLFGDKIKVMFSQILKFPFNENFFFFKYTFELNKLTVTFIFID